MCSTIISQRYTKIYGGHRRSNGGVRVPGKAKITAWDYWRNHIFTMLKIEVLYKTIDIPTAE